MKVLLKRRLTLLSKGQLKRQLKSHFVKMASNYKSSKTELIAIYRLEFYKNKKNWKLCKDVRKEPPGTPSSKSKSKHLNETYDVEAELDVEQVSPHNKAFLHEEPTDDAPEIEFPPNPEVAVVPANQHLCQQAWVDQQWTSDNDDAWQGGQQEWCVTDAESVPENIPYTDQCNGPCHQHVWTSANQYEQTKTQHDQEQEYFSPAQLLALAEDWLQSHGYPLQQQEYAQYYEQYGFLDESADFVRGAHNAPHSSEIDLSLTATECACPHGDLANLSARQLAAHMCTHAAALRELLTEEALRDRMYSQTSLSPPLPYDEYPTRDTSPLRPADTVLSGSHRAVRPPDSGRGRGRLRTADRLIAIGMGRPYRL